MSRSTGTVKWFSDPMGYGFNTDRGLTTQDLTRTQVAPAG